MIKSSLIVGFFGDLGLQAIVNNSKEDNKYGLKTYFKQHGILESAFIGSGMMGIFTLIYKMIDPSYNKIGMCIYGGGLDILFRNYHKTIFPSLTDYYKNLTPEMSLIWGVIPILMTIGVDKIIN